MVDAETVGRKPRPDLLIDWSRWIKTTTHQAGDEPEDSRTESLSRLTSVRESDCEDGSTQDRKRKRSGSSVDESQRRHFKSLRRLEPSGLDRSMGSPDKTPYRLCAKVTKYEPVQDPLKASLELFEDPLTAEEDDSHVISIMNESYERWGEFQECCPVEDERYLKVHSKGSCEAVDSKVAKEEPIDSSSKAGPELIRDKLPKKEDDDESSDDDASDDAEDKTEIKTHKPQPPTLKEAQTQHETALTALGAVYDNLKADSTQIKHRLAHSRASVDCTIKGLRGELKDTCQTVRRLMTENKRLQKDIVRLEGVVERMEKEDRALWEKVNKAFSVAEKAKAKASARVSDGWG